MAQLVVFSGSEVKAEMRMTMALNAKDDEQSMEVKLMRLKQEQIVGLLKVKKVLMSAKLTYLLVRVLDSRLDQIDDTI